jgi:hypothetical protein
LIFASGAGTAYPSVSSQGRLWSCIYVLKLSIVSLSTILRFDFGIAPTEWYLLSFSFYYSPLSMASKMVTSGNGTIGETRRLIATEKVIRADYRDDKYSHLYVPAKMRLLFLEILKKVCYVQVARHSPNRLPTFRIII